MASLQARHQDDCAIVQRRARAKQQAGETGNPNHWSTFADATKAKGCACKPLYHLAFRDGGKLVREPVGHNRKEAERALDARRGDVARGDYRVVKDITFSKWADEWLASLTGKQTTRNVYASTVAYANATFGGRKLRQLAPSDVERFLARISEANRRPATEDDPGREVAPANLAKHLRQLGACLESAIPEYAMTNPVRLLHKTKRPKVAKTLPTYYTDAEVARLWPELAYRPVILAICKTAVATGARFGELAALRWSDVNLLERELHVGRSWTPRLGETSPKSGEARTVDLTPPAAAVLEAWYAESGTDGKGLVFPRDDGNGDKEHLDSPSVLKQALYPALERAGIPRVGEKGGTRDFHAFRNTFARIALEAGATIDWTSQQLGHSNITLTVNAYGHWSRAAQKLKAKKLAKAFGGSL